MLPQYFRNILAEQYKSPDINRILAGCSEKRIVTLRANTLVSTRDTVATALNAAGITWKNVNWYSDAFVLPDAHERDVQKLSIYQNGSIYLQSLSSMLPALALNAHPQEDICDMCAAPGGKTTQIAALSHGAYITACEMHAPRAKKLEYNLQKLNATNVTVLRCDARKLDDFFTFDRILVDAPCSGSGTLFAENPKNERYFTSKLIEKSIKSQRALMSKGLSLLKKDGILIYSTCSILACENEEIIDWALSHTPRNRTFKLIPLEFANADFPLLPNNLDGTITLCPTKYYEGFFLAKIIRKA